MREQVAGAGLGRTLNADAAKRLDRLARSSEVIVEALGPFAFARLEFTMTLERLGEPLQVQAPAAAP